VRKYILALECRGYRAYICHPSVDGDVNIKGVIHFQVGDYPTFFALQPCIDSRKFCCDPNRGPFQKLLIKDRDLVLLIRVP
jgi:hypothetical protein